MAQGLIRPTIEWIEWLIRRWVMGNSDVLRNLQKLVISRTRLLLEFTKEVVLRCLCSIILNTWLLKNQNISFYTLKGLFQMHFVNLHYLFWLLSSWAAAFLILYQICQRLNYSNGVVNSGLKKNAWPFFVHQFLTVSKFPNLSQLVTVCHGPLA